MNRQARKDEKAERKRAKKEAEGLQPQQETPDSPPDGGTPPAQTEA